LPWDSEVKLCAKGRPPFEDEEEEKLVYEEEE